jgi:hypothetical protein
MNEVIRNNTFIGFIILGDLLAMLTFINLRGLVNGK